MISAQISVDVPSVYLPVNDSAVLTRAVSVSRGLPIISKYYLHCDWTQLVTC